MLSTAEDLGAEEGSIVSQKSRRLRRAAIAASLMTALALGACGIAAESASAAASGSAFTRTSASTSGTASTADTPPAPPSGGGGGSGPGGSGSSSAVVGTGALTVTGGTKTESGSTITASTKDESGVLVKSGSLTLNDVAVSTTGSSSSSDDSSFYGLDSGVLALAGTSITETGGSVTTTGDGANAVFSYGSKSKITIRNTKISATGQYAHGIMASGGGSITAKNLTVTTTGASSAAVATDRGSGTIKVTGGTYTTSGHNSPGLYSTGKLSAKNATFIATGSEAAVIEGSNSVTVTNSSLTSGANRGVMIYQSFSGDASGSTGTFTETGGSLTAKAGPLFYVTNASGKITLNHVKLTAASGVLLNAAAGDWGTSGSNGGNAELVASKQKLAGDITVDKVSTATITLSKGSKLTGAIDAAGTAKKTSLTLDSSSTWVVTANSHVTVLSGLTISGSKVTNITGNGHTVYYSSSANPTLGGKTYQLAGGGTLTPAS